MREYIRQCLIDAPEFLIADMAGEDLSGKGRHATLIGSRNVTNPGPFLELRPYAALSSVDYLQVPFSPFGATATVECWFRSTATTEIWAFGSSRTNPTSLQSFDYGIGSPPTQSVSGRAWCCAHTDNTAVGKYSTNTFNDGLWHHFVCKSDSMSSSTNMHMFVDGVWQSSATTFATGSGFANQSGALNYWIWRMYQTATYPGSACLWAWYSQQLVDDRILAHYNAGRLGGLSPGRRHRLAA